MIFKKILIIYLLQVSLVFASELYNTKKKQQNMVEMIQTSGNNYENTEKEFNIEYKKAMNRANDEQKKELERNQKLWLDFVESTCKLENSLDSQYGRSNYYGCKNNELKKRIEQLKNLFTFLI